MVKILEVQIKVQDEKGHVKILTKDDIDHNSIIIKTKKQPKSEDLLFVNSGINDITGVDNISGTNGESITFTEPKEKPKKKAPRRKRAKSA